MSCTKLRLAISSLLVVCVLTNAAYFIHGATDDAEMMPEIVGTLLHVDNLWVLNRARDELIEEPLFVKVAYADDIARLLTDNTVLSTSDYVRNPDGHDLNCVAGRAAWILDTVYKIKSKPIDDKSTAEDLRIAFDRASAQLAAFERGIMETVRHYQIGANVEALKDRFQNRLLADSPDGGWRLSPAAWQPMIQMLDEWFPLGKPLKDLEQIVGRKPAYLEHVRREAPMELNTATGLFEFLCAGGLHSTSFQFRVENGTIVDVNIRSME